MHRLELKVPPLIVVAVTVGLMALTAWLAPMKPWHFTDATSLAWTLVVAGGLVALAGVSAFRRARTTVNPMHPDTSSTLVTSGIYRYTRNPMYLGFLLILAGMVSEPTGAVMVNWLCAVPYPFSNYSRRALAQSKVRG